MVHKAPKKKKHPRDMTTEEAVKHLFQPKVVGHVNKHAGTKNHAWREKSCLRNKSSPTKLKKQSLMKPYPIYEERKFFADNPRTIAVRSSMTEIISMSLVKWACRFNLFLLLTAPVFAQNVRYDNIALSSPLPPNSAFIPNPVVTAYQCSFSAGVCNQGTRLNGYCSGSTDTSCTVTNPITGDNFGNYGFWLPPGSYYITVTKAGFSGYNMTVALPCCSNIQVVSPTESLAQAYAALPSCTIANDLNAFTGSSYHSLTWSHCGTIYIPSGSYTISSTVNITSPWVHIIGSDNGDTILNFTGTSGCAIQWTAIPFAYEFVNGPSIENVRIDGGQSNPAGTCGLNNYNMSSLHTKNLTIANFDGSGSVCFNNTMDTGWNEKQDIELLTDNCATHFQTLRNSAGSGNTSGYGRYELKMGIFAGQTGFLVDGGSQNAVFFTYSLFHLVANEFSNTANDTVIQLRNGAIMQSNLYMIHIEAPFPGGTESQINIAPGSTFSGLGFLDQSNPGSNVINGVFTPITFGAQGNNDTFSMPTANFTRAAGDNVASAISGTQTVALASGWYYGLKSAHAYSGSGASSGNFYGLFGAATQNGTGSMTFLQGAGSQLMFSNSGTVTWGQGFHVLSPNVSGGGNATNVCGLCIDQQNAAGITNAYGIYQRAAGDKNLLGGPVQANSQLYVGESGSCTMVSGTCSAQSLTKTYSTAPRCFASWNGSGTLTGILKVPSTTSTVTPASSVNTDTAVVNWECHAASTSF